MLEAAAEVVVDLHTLILLEVVVEAAARVSGQWGLEELVAGRAEMAALEAKLQQALHALTLASYGTHSQKCPLDSLRMPS